MAKLENYISTKVQSFKERKKNHSVPCRNQFQINI